MQLREKEFNCYEKIHAHVLSVQWELANVNQKQ